MLAILGVILLIVKFMGDMIARIPVFGNMIPGVSGIAGLGILYPVSFAMILYGMFRSKVAAIAIFFIVFGIMLYNGMVMM